LGKRSDQCPYPKNVAAFSRIFLRKLK